MTSLGQLAALPAMRVYVCKKCNTAYVVPEMDPEIHLLQKSMRCPNAESCNGRIKVYATTNIKIDNSLRVSALHLYQASLGAGLPMEKRCGPKELRRLLLGNTVSEVRLVPSPDPHRSIIMSMTLSTGKVIHFSASTRGATVFKVTEA